MLTKNTSSFLKNKDEEMKKEKSLLLLIKKHLIHKNFRDF